MEQFHFVEKTNAATVDNGSNMDVAFISLNFLNVNPHHKRFLTFLQFPTGVPKSVWLKRSSLSKTVLREKQQILSK